MKTLIFTAALSAISLVSFSQEFTLKSAIEKLKTSEVQNQISNYMDGSEFKSYFDQLNLDLKLTVSKNKILVTSASDFEFFRVNENRIPQSAKFNFSIFHFKFSVDKKDNQISCELR